MNSELIRIENGALCFGDYRLNEKGKASGFEFAGDIYKVKSFCDITKLEKNEMLAYESEPGTIVSDYREDENGIRFLAEGIGMTQIILAVDNEAVYAVYEDGKEISSDESLNGKLVFSLELKIGERKAIVIEKK